MKRLNKGDAYHFISIKDLKVCHTNDWYFYTDDQRFEKENYFCDSAAAHECLDAIKDKYEAKLEKLEAQKEDIRTDYIKLTLSLAKAAKPKKATSKKKEPKPDEPQPMTQEEVLKALIQAADAYLATRTEIYNAITEITMNIENIIKKAPKTI